MKCAVPVDPLKKKNYPLKHAEAYTDKSKVHLKYLNKPTSTTSKGFKIVKENTEDKTSNQKVNGNVHNCEQPTVSGIKTKGDNRHDPHFGKHFVISEQLKQNDISEEFKINEQESNKRENNENENNKRENIGHENNNRETNEHENNEGENTSTHLNSDVELKQEESTCEKYPSTSNESANATSGIKSMDVQHGVFSEHPVSPKPPHSADKTDNRERLADETSADMRLADERLKTFANWPVSFLKPETLADNGFYYLNRGDEVRCAFCKVEIMRWEPGDDPAADHRKWAPQCPFLRCAAGPAPPAGGPAPPASPAGPAPPRGVDECGARAPAPRMPGPANPKYATLAARLASFEHWPLSLGQRQNPRDLADAGFFYTGKGDQTKCFYCDGGLKDWEDDDVPWEQHARWFGRCAYVQLVKGRDYVQRVMTEASVTPAPRPAAQSEPADPPAPEPESTPAQDEKICKICFEEERNVCFVPCGHVVACAKCALATNKCPLCRKTFTDAVRIYFA